jgi:hypothetical protein
MPSQVRTFVVAGVEVALGQAEASRAELIKASSMFSAFWNLIAESVEKVEEFSRGLRRLSSVYWRHTDREK